MTHDLLEKFPTTAVRKHYANVAVPWALGHNNRELLLPTLDRDPFYVLREAPPRTHVFRFYDRIVAPVTIDGENMEIRSERLDWSREQFFINVTRVVTRDEISKRWRFSYNPRMLREMDEYETDHLVLWDTKADYRYLPYWPDRGDVLLTR